MQIQTFVFNHFGQNTYLIIDETTSNCAIVDPGCFFDEEKQKIKNFIKDKNLTLEKILFTHCHLDHAFGAKFISKEFNPIPVFAHKNESIFIEDAINQSLRFGISMEQPPKITNFVNDGDEVSVGSLSFKAIHVPGHSPGSICYYNAPNNVIFCGDVLFNGSIGRSDLPGGNHQQLISGIKEKLMPLPDNTIVYSGHGPTTTIKIERDTNPHL